MLDAKSINIQLAIKAKMFLCRNEALLLSFSDNMLNPNLNPFVLYLIFWSLYVIINVNELPYLHFSMQVYRLEENTKLYLCIKM